MKKIKLLTIVLGLSLLMLPLTMWADEYEKSYSETYSVNSDAHLSINNKFGDLHVQNWDKNEVSIEVTVTVEASSESKAQKVLDKIDVEISGTKDLVKAVTSIGEHSFSNVEFSIDYEVMMPRSLQVNLVNKFGEIMVDEVDGKAMIDIAYGELEVSSLNNESSKLDVKFGEANVGYFAGNDIQLSYSELSLKGGKNLDLVSRFSESSIENLNKLDLDSQYDEVEVGKVGDVKVVCQFSELTFEKVSGNFNFDLQYGGLEIEMIEAMDGTCFISNKFASVELTFGSGVSFEMEAELKFASLDYPKDKADLDKRQESFTTNVYNGKIGKGSPDGKLVIESRNGDVSINY